MHGVWDGKQNGLLCSQLGGMKAEKQAGRWWLIGLLYDMSMPYVLRSSQMRP